MSSFRRGRGRERGRQQFARDVLPTFLFVLTLLPPLPLQPRTKNNNHQRRLRRRWRLPGRRRLRRRRRRRLRRPVRLGLKEKRSRAIFLTFSLFPFGLLILLPPRLLQLLQHYQSMLLSVPFFDFRCHLLMYGRREREREKRERHPKTRRRQRRRELVFLGCARSQTIEMEQRFEGGPSFCGARQRRRRERERTKKNRKRNQSKTTRNTFFFIRGNSHIQTHTHIHTHTRAHTPKTRASLGSHR